MNDGNRFPILTWLICSACVVLSAGYWLSGGGGDPARAAMWGNYPPEAIWSGRYGALIASTFLHAPLTENPFHILFNVLWLTRIGALVERQIGHLEYGVFCLGAALVASGTELGLFGSTGIGMSGVVYALFGLAWGARRTIPLFGAAATDDNVRLMMGWLVLCFVLTQAGMWNIANGAHAGGLVFGLSVAWLFFEKGLPAWRKAAAAATLALVTILTVLAVTYLPWSARWRSWKASPTPTAAAAPRTE